MKILPYIPFIGSLGGNAVKTLSYINFILAALFTACCFYQAIYALLRLRGKRRRFEARKLCRYAVLIAARNEEAVIGQLLDSIRGQDYPADLVDVFVVADNCTDNTAQVAAQHGAAVYERFHKALVGKGYALSFLLEKIKEDRPQCRYDGYFVFDADNLLDPGYITEMNKVFSSGNRVVTGYRNSKNFGDNWITAGYSLYFLRDCEYMNQPRDYLGVSSVVSGTGFLFAHSILEECGGWNYHLLSEDMEFTVDMVLRGEKIAYCRDAVLYDEQPTGFLLSISQRSRWIKGYFQVIASRGKELLRALFKTGNFSCYDTLMGILPAGVLAILSFLLNAIMLVVGLVSAPQELPIYFASVLTALCSSYVLLFLMGLLVLLTEWKRIVCPAPKKVLYAFTFPIFICTFVFAMLRAMFGSVQWKPIRHDVALSIGDLGGRR